MSLVQALINSGNASTPKEADDLIMEMQERVYVGEEDPEEVLAEYGLEPDYVFDLIG